MVKIGVVGDSHFKHQYIDRAMEHLKDVDLIIHTGDHYGDVEYIIENYNANAIGVRGNCDSIGELEIIKEIEGKRFFICHGDRYDVKRSLNTIFYRGKEVGADIVIFGHSHIPCYGKEEEMILLNPGSVSEPRGGSNRSLAILRIDREIDVEFIEIP